MGPLIESIFAGKRGKIAIALVVLVVAAASWWFLRERSAEAEFITEPVEHGSVRNVVNATGTVQALLTVQVGSQVSGQIESLYADFNSVVKRGQILAKLDPRRYQAAVTEAQANLQAAQARVHTSEADLNSTIASRASSQANAESARVARDNTAQILARYEQLRKDGILSQNDYDTAKANADSAAAKYSQAKAQLDQVEAQINSSRASLEQTKAQVEQAQAALKQAELDLGYTTISSPVDGVVVSRSVDVGQTVAASLQAPTLFVIANDLSKMQLNAAVDEADIGNIADVEDVQFTVDAYPNRTFNGRISEVRLDPSTVQNVTTYSVIIYVNNERLELKPGMTANIAITVAKQDNVLRLPNAAMRYLPPGVTRDDVAELLKKLPPVTAAGAEPSGAAAKAEVSPEPSALAMPSSADSGEGQSGRFQRQDNGGAPQGDRQGQRQQGQQEAGARRGGVAPTQPAQLAPGQMWNPAEKIQFPQQRRHNGRAAIVWVLGANNKPEPRQVLLGITDGRMTQVISGDLKDGDAVIVSDSSQAAAAPTQQTRGPGGQGGGRFIFGGGR